MFLHTADMFTLLYISLCPIFYWIYVYIYDKTVLMILIGLGFTASNTAGNCSQVPPGYYVSIR